MFTKAYLQELGNGKLRIEEQLLLAECERRGVPVSLYLAKHMQRRQLPLTVETFVAGDIDALHAAMQQLKIVPPPPNDYPESLSPFLHRRVWKSMLGTIEQRFQNDGSEPVFVKPAQRRKNFRGRVFASSDDFREIGGVSRRQEVWCSEVVEWRAEFRVYVIGPDVVSIDHYCGNRDLRLDPATLDNALEIFRSSGQAPSAYGIDFGVLPCGQTALIEANDGFALGAYDIDGSAYTDLVMTRWRELVGGREGSN